MLWLQSEVVQVWGPVLWVKGQCSSCILMELALVLQKVMYGCHITHCQSLIRHQQQPRKISGIESPNQQEPDRGRNISPETKKWSELASDASLAAIQLRSPVLRMGLSGKKKRQERKRKNIWGLAFQTRVYMCTIIYTPFSCNFLEFLTLFLSQKPFRAISCFKTDAFCQTNICIYLLDALIAYSYCGVNRRVNSVTFLNVLQGKMLIMCTFCIYSCCIPNTPS